MMRHALHHNIGTSGRREVAIRDRSASCVPLVPAGVAILILLFPSTQSPVAWGNAAETYTAEQLEFFENEVRPLLVTHCYECHSGDTIEANLRLDTRAGWQQGGDSGPPIVPGEPEKSRLIEAIRYENTALQMPPDGKLSADNIATIAKWIQLGAPDPRVDGEIESQLSEKQLNIEQRMREHWAWQPVQQVIPPVVQQSTWPLKDLDRFVLSGLEEAGLAPAPPADKHVWLRRVSFDLTGLPPTLEQLQAFLDDNSPAAYERVVERLLQSPHFGEHWGQHWLDLCRFAETRGHEQDYAIPEAYRFRDYVITALNLDVPYNQFVVEHLAGDLVDPPRLHPDNRTNQSIQGTGFWHLHEATHSPVDIRGDEADRVHNQLDVFSKAFLGLSLGCARCHDHKFDPIATADYYAMFGFLQSSSYQLVDVSDPPMRESIYDQLLAARSEFVPKLKQASIDLHRQQLALWPKYLIAARTIVPAIDWETLAASEQLDPKLLSRLVEYLRTAEQSPDDPLANVVTSSSPADSVPATSTNEHPITIVEDFTESNRNHWITSGYRFGARPASLGEIILGRDATRPIERILAAPAAEAGLVSNKLTGFLRTKTFEITGDQLWYHYRGQADLFLNVDSHLMVAGPLHGVVKQTLQGDPHKWQWFAQPVRDYLGHRVHVEFSPKEQFAVDQIVFSNGQPADATAVTTNTNPDLRQTSRTIDAEQASTAAEQIVERFTRALDAWQNNSLSPASVSDLQWLIDHPELLPSVDEAKPTTADIFQEYVAKRELLERQLPEPVYAIAMLDGDGEDEPIHIRGNHRNRGAEPVPRAVLTAMRGASWKSPEFGSGRLQLAQQLTDPSNPLIARVMVNRIWHHLFGRGIVETVDDFGVMGKRPSHPQLLDHLADRFIANGWSIKHMIREIVLSRTYGMSSHPGAALAGVGDGETIDPDNVLLHRMSVRRLRAESLRDHILAVSGQLDHRMYGPSVMVYIPPTLRSSRSPSGNGPLDGDRRRSIYTEVRRNHMSSFLSTFDKPTPFTAIGKRTQSNSPSQALILMNDPFVHEQAAHWATKLLADPVMDDHARLEQAYLVAYSRRPTDEEIIASMEFLAAQAERYHRSGIDQPATAAWTDICHILMNVKEFFHIN